MLEAKEERGMLGLRDPPRRFAHVDNSNWLDWLLVVALAPSSFDLFPLSSFFFSSAHDKWTWPSFGHGLPFFSFPFLLLFLDTYCVRVLFLSFLSFSRRDLRYDWCTMVVPSPPSLEVLSLLLWSLSFLFLFHWFSLLLCFFLSSFCSRCLVVFFSPRYGSSLATKTKTMIMIMMTTRLLTFTIAISARAIAVSEVSGGTRLSLSLLWSL